ncbi:hypothetical protein [Exiguobacterium sp. s5]|uniref:hypothetical protein n=1 Tax=Exiguobacterium sp. s5 TaxID=2751239 RepID=UPI001BE6F3F1|nr:hypothetical protein [Exiguobacterium sp. s5]
MSIKQDMIRLLTDVYKKTEGSNINKYITLVAEQFDKLHEVFSAIESARIIDDAFGGSLDEIGKNVGEPRLGQNDEQYREALKVALRANLSKGDLNTVISMARSLYGQDVLSISETWSIDRYDYEPAGLVMVVESTMDEGLDLNFQLLKRVMAVGVRLYIEVYQPRSRLQFQSDLTDIQTRSVMLGLYTASYQNLNGVIRG